MTTDIERLQRLAAAVEEERRVPERERATGAADASLDGVTSRLRQATEELRAGRTDAALRALEHVRYAVAESWSYDAELSNALLGHIRALHDAAGRRRP